jgi:ABC-type uncharacterized transport system permease subunit
MREKTRQLLTVGTFIGLAVTFDYVTVAAVYTVGFDGIARAVLAATCLIVGTIAAFVLTAPIIRVVAKRRD